MRHDAEWIAPAQLHGSIRKPNESGEPPRLLLYPIQREFVGRSDYRDFASSVTVIRPRYSAGPSHGQKVSQQAEQRGTVEITGA